MSCISVAGVQRFKHVVDVCFFSIRTSDFEVLPREILSKQHLDREKCDERAVPNDNLISRWLSFRVFSPIIWLGKFCRTMGELVSNPTHKINA